MTNYHPETGVRYTIYHINNDLHPDVWDLINNDGVDLSWQESSAAFGKRAGHVLDHMLFILGLDVPKPHREDMISDLLDHFHQQYECDEPVYVGETLAAEGSIKWRTTWLGGAPHLIVFESPYYGVGRECSPCVPGCVDGHTVQMIFRDEDAAGCHASVAGATYGYCLPTTWLRGKEG